LLAFSGIVGDDFVKAQQAAADMAARMGTDIASAAETIGRALDVPSQGMAALSRQGFRFTEEQKELVKWLEETGRKSQAQGIILEALEETYDGAAAAARDSFGGALTAVKNNISSLLAGEDGSLDGAKEALETFNQVLTDPKTKAQFAEIAQSVISGLTYMVEHAGIAVKAFEYLGKTLEGIKTVFNLTGQAIATGAAAVKDGVGDALESVKNNPLELLKGPRFLTAHGVAKQFFDPNSATREGGRAMHKELMGFGQPQALPTLPAANQELPKFSEDKAGAASNEEALKKEHALWQASEKRRAEQEKAAKAAALAHQKQQEAINKELTALERAAKTWGMNADEVKLYDLAIQGANKNQLAQAQQQLEIVAKLEEEQSTRENYLTLVKTLQTEEERRKETLAEQLALIKAMEQLTGESDKETFKRVAMGSFDHNMPADSFKDDSDPFKALDEASKAQEEWYAQQLELLNQYREQRQDLNDEWDEKEKALKEQHEEGLAAIQKAKWDEGMKGMTDALSAMSTLQDSENKKMRAVGKAAAIAQTIISTYQAATAAMASAATIPIVGWVMAPIAAAAIAAAGMANVAKIKGVAHSGIDRVPETGTWLLEKGERVTTAHTSAKLDATLERISKQQQASQGRRERGRGSAVINQTIQVQGQVDARTASQLAAEGARNQRRVEARFG
ncbi:hypothetical protein AXE65_08815, partial [Ventosimonas gracilis]